MTHDARVSATAGLRAVVLLLFFASGFVALLYQVIWQRLLGLATGLDLYAVTLIVAVFMGGMGAGSFAGGVWADRLPASRLLGLFAVSETVIAAFALASKPLYHDLLRPCRRPGCDATSTMAAPRRARATTPMATGWSARDGWR